MTCPQLHRQKVAEVKDVYTHYKCDHVWSDCITRFEIKKILCDYFYFYKEIRDLHRRILFYFKSMVWLFCAAGSRFLKLLLVGLEFLSSAI